ncbi:hypothetical protein OROMI_010175 [Orobanche minor]
MYRGKNGKYRCSICSYSNKTTKEMDEHMKDEHPVQAKAYLATQTQKPPRTRSPRPAKSSVASSLLSSGTNAPKFVQRNLPWWGLAPMLSADDIGQPSESHPVSIDQAGETSNVSHPPGEFTFQVQTLPDNICDDFFPTFPFSFLMNMGLDVIKCRSKEEALMKHKILSTMPKPHFIRSACACTLDGAPCVAVEQYQTISYRAEEHRQSALRAYNQHNTGIQLEISGILHVNLTKLVDVDLLPKYHSIPTHYDSYNTFRKNIGKQCQQICEGADQIIGAEGVKNKEY